MLVDTHVHVISGDRARYPQQPTSLPGTWYREAPVTAEELLELMDDAGVDRAVLVQPMSAYAYANRYAADSARARPDRFASACIVDVDGDDPVGDLDHWVNEHGMGGLRLFTLSAPIPTWLGEPRCAAVIGRAAQLGAPVSVLCLADQLPRLRRTLEQFPDVPITLDHCAFDPEAVLGFAELSNLYLEVTTTVLDMSADRGNEPRDVVAVLVDGFGADRVIRGSDFSQTHDRAYRELVAFGRDAVSRLSQTDQRLVLGGTALRLWPALVGAPER
jgi:L-fuconolactonase